MKRWTWLGRVAALVVMVSVFSSPGSTGDVPDDPTPTGTQDPSSGSVAQFEGTLTDEKGVVLSGPARATFAIYEFQTGGVVLWEETQNIEVDGQGRYTVMLGTTKPEGLPRELLSGGARWLGVRVEGRQEQKRVQISGPASQPQAPPKNAQRTRTEKKNLKLRRLKLKLDNAFALGREDAPALLIEFTDYECPNCKQFHFLVFEQLKKDFINTGKLRFVSLDLPLQDIHPHAWKAAHAGRCAGEQGKFWEMRHALISAKLRADSFLKLAAEVQLDVPRFEACWKKEKYSKDVHRDMAEARFFDVHGTPTFILGRPVSQGIEGAVFSAGPDYRTFEALIEQVLEEGRTQ